MRETERLHYPVDPKLREAYIGILGMLCLQKRIKFTAPECINAICERNGWVADTDHHGATKTSGQAKKAKNFLQILAEGKKYVRRTGLMFEICMYDASTRERIISFDELFATIGNDKYLSEYLEPVDELIFREWEDVVDLQTQSPSIHQISEEVERVLSATAIIEDEIETSITSFNTTPVLYPLSQEEEKKSESSLEDDGIESVGSLI